MSKLHSIEDLNWYHPNADRHVAESLLMQNGQDGTYLLRPSSKSGTYTLSVRGQDSVKHFKVVFDGTTYQFGMAVFKNVEQFVDHFASQPLLAGESGVVTLLKHPYPRIVVEPGQYDCIKIHAQIGQPLVINDPPPLALGSKEGFLTKQGGLIKNWKLRWFVLKKFDFQYFAQRSDTEPIRSLDLRECRLCTQDTSQGQEYCFRLVFPWRTFYLRASNGADAKEWIELIQWKLKRLNSKSV